MGRRWYQVPYSTRLRKPFRDLWRASGIEAGDACEPREVLTDRPRDATIAGSPRTEGSADGKESSCSSLDCPRKETKTCP